MAAAVAFTTICSALLQVLLHDRRIHHPGVSRFTKSSQETRQLRFKCKESKLTYGDVIWFIYHVLQILPIWIYTSKLVLHLQMCDEASVRKLDRIVDLP